MSDPAGRYDALPTYARRPPVGPPIQLRVPRVVPTSAVDGRHEVRAGERIDHLAVRLFADPYAWWRFPDANPGVDLEHLDDPGRLLRLPAPGGTGPTDARGAGRGGAR